VTDLIIGALVLTGSAFAAIAALGVLRMPDLLTRMHAATKAGALGATLVLAAVAVSFADGSITVRALATIVFLLLTAPIASHVLGRAAYRSGRLTMAPQTCLDEFADDLASGAHTTPSAPRRGDSAAPAAAPAAPTAAASAPASR
jgi:multicomponent Na+:H+ antiporter subunit G